jgi:outer membrane protein OmpA-like peptidoglycan-associated protein
MLTGCFPFALINCFCFAMHVILENKYLSVIGRVMKTIFGVIFFSLFILSCTSATKPTSEKTCHPKVTILKGVNFDYDKSNIKPESYPVLDENIALLKSRPKMTITIVGHTDNNGGAAYNQKLSVSRANAVMQYFLEHGIPAGRMKMLGKGQFVPIADNKTDAGKALNRRIEIEFVDPDPDVICE